MKFSEYWLRELVNPDISTTELCEQLTMAGLEVEEVQSVAGKFTDVVIGEIVDCIKHPNANKLKLAKVKVAEKKLLDIVCGAPNCRIGLKVAVAMVGANLPNGIRIKKVKLRGVLSNGMLCSFYELGMMDEQDGIIELPIQAQIGYPLYDYLKTDDKIIDINVTPNRSDCLSIVGIARELGALNSLSINYPVIYPVKKMNNANFSVEVKEVKSCPCYFARIIKNIKIDVATLIWLKEKLRRCGFKSINPVVDITNYVLLELGQPMHAFDFNQIVDGVVIRMAHPKEKLMLLNHKEVLLDEKTLIISDHEKPLALAGILGGEESAVKNDTQHIFLESAYFSPTAIAGCARRYGLCTEASRRYERGVDPTIQEKAMHRSTQLILEICGGEPSSIISINNSESLTNHNTVTLRQQKLAELLGYPIDSKEISSILNRIGCKFTYVNKTWEILSPSWRFDLHIEEDFIGEIARIYGYNNIPSTQINTKLLATKPEAEKLSLSRVKHRLVDRGYQEVITYSFIDPETQSFLQPGVIPLTLKNPISKEMSIMRSSLWNGLIRTLIYNKNHQQSRIRLFESGLCFHLEDTVKFCLKQKLMLAGLISGTRFERSWVDVDDKVDFYDIKGDVQAILQLTGDEEAFNFVQKVHPALHPGQSAAICYNQEVIGHIGALHPELEKKLDLNNQVFLFEIVHQALEKKVLPIFKEINNYPINSRDIAIIVPKKIIAGDVVIFCKQLGIRQLVGVNLFDVYCGRGVNEGYKSLGINLLLQDNTHTLNEEEISSIVNQCIEALIKNFQASLRN